MSESHTKRVIPLAHNESYWLLDDKLIEAYASVDARSFSTYAHYTNLREKLAAYVGARVENVLATPGSDAAIRMYGELCVKNGLRVLLPVPTFYGYERIFATLGLPFGAPVYAEANGEFQFPLMETLEAIESDSVDVVFLCQPNNPLGAIISDESIEWILAAARKHDVTIVVDEAYIEFAGTSLAQRIHDQNIVVFRTMSKAFGLAGARVGYCIADVETIAALQSRMLPWPIAHSSVQAALAALAMREKLIARLKLLIDQRDLFAASLREVPGITVYPSATNFVLTRVPDADAVHARLLEQGIVVAKGAPMSSIPEAGELLANTVRLGTPAPEDMAVVLDAIRQVMDK